jgi:hypothetical protein
MGTLVIEKNTLQVMLLEIILKDKFLSKDIFKAIINENPHFLEEELSTKAQTLSIPVDEEDPHFPVLEGLTPERKKWLNETINKDFSKYEDVFKALA